MDMVEEYTMTSTFAPWIIIISHFLLGIYTSTSKNGIVQTFNRISVTFTTLIVFIFYVCAYADLFDLL